jgi:DNA (cytosine-5)-methyltransferase 1
MSAYYNENDPFAAAWLSELIKAGHIAPGDVDERSVEDVLPSDLRGYAQCHFFAGIGGWSLALRSAGPTNGHWRSADWLACRDGKWRPVEPGTFPLADGLPARVGRLRGYGNAIVPQAAAAFVRAYLT